MPRDTTGKIVRNSVSVISFGKNAKFLIGYEFKEPEPDTRNVLGDPF